MIPVLYESTETNFTTNGLGRLSDVIECNVIEERNGKYELSMKYPLTGVHFEDLEMHRIIFAIPSDGKDPQPFGIYYISKPINGICEIKAEHISYRQSLIPVSPFSSTTVAGALLGLEQNAEESCPFTFWTDKTTTGDFTVDKPSSMRSLLGGSQGSVLDVYGGEYEFDGFTVKLHNARGQDKGVTLRYGKNITDIRQEENISSVYTGVMPYWKGTVDQVETLVMLPEKVLHASTASNFPYQRTIPLDLTSEFQNQPTEAELRTRALSYMNANKFGVPDISIKVSFVALWQSEEYKNIANLERVNLCDTVHVYFPKLNIIASAKVIETDYNVLKERYNSIELGETKSNFAATVKKDIQSSAAQVTADLPTKSYLQQAVDRATRLITGGLGGHVVFTLNANGEPQEILIMDTDDIQTAVEVLRINQNGIGFSSQGYAGPFATAWTLDGHFVADFIDTGNLSASLITTGTMTANRIEGGLLKMGGRANGNGIIQLYDANNSLLFTLDNNGLLYKSDPSMTVPIVQSYRKFGDSGFAEQTIYMGIHGVQVYSPAYYDGSINSLHRGIALVNGEIRFFNHDLSTIRIRGVAEVNRIEFPTVTFYDDSTYIKNNLSVSGSFSATGSKNRIVKTEDYGDRLQSAYEMCSPMFGDIGSGITDENGECHVFIDPVFAQTVSLDNYYVFIQSSDGSPMEVLSKNSSYFVVKGKPSSEFDWEIKAKQLGYENHRNERHNNDADKEKDMRNYGEVATNYIAQLKEGRLSA